MGSVPYLYRACDFGKRFFSKSSSVVSSPASGPLPKFVIHRGTFRLELRKQRGTSNSMILVPLFDLKFLERVCGNCCRNFKAAALVLKRLCVHGLDSFGSIPVGGKVGTIRGRHGGCCSDLGGYRGC